MSTKGWISLGTVVFLAIILFFARHDLVMAWELLQKVNVWILALVVPVLFIDYMAVGGMIFSYLKVKDPKLKISPFTLARLSLELNFVNHALPSGGLSGVAYMNWRLGKFGVSSGRASMAQVVRFVVGFMAYLVLLVLAVLIVTIDGQVNRWVILVSSLLMFVMVSFIVGMIYLVNNGRRIERFARKLAQFANSVVKKITFGKIKHPVKAEKLEAALSEMHEDYLEIKRNKRVLARPFMWALIFTITDVAVFWITFWALGHPVNPAPIFIAYGISTLAGLVVITPGGAGVYEALMVAFLAIAGLSPGLTLAGVLLARVMMLLLAIGGGFIFYQKALHDSGTDTKPAL